MTRLRATRLARKRREVCIYCESPLDPASTLMCSVHRARHYRYSLRWQETAGMPACEKSRVLARRILPWPVLGAQSCQS